MNDLDLTGLSARNRRALALGVRGGDGDDPVEPSVLLSQVAGIADLTDEDLVSLHDQLVAAGNELVSDPTAVTDEDLAQAQEIATAVQTLRTAYIERAVEAEARADQANAIAAALNPTAETDGGDGEDGDGEGETEGEGDGSDGAGDGEGDGAGETGTEAGGEGEGATGEGETEVVPLAASAARAKARRPKSMNPRTKPAKEFALRASANVAGEIRAGEVLDTPDKIIKAMEPAIRAAAGYAGPRTQIPLFTLGSFDPADVFGKSRVLGRDAQANEAMIESVAGPAALRASGGICAPVPVEYDLPILGSTDARPVRDAYARFGATRGGVRLLPPPMLVDLEDAIGIWTEANDTIPGSDGPATKPCLVLDCPDDEETLVAAITKCLKIGNFRARFFPEQVTAWTKLAGVQQAKIADTRLIQKMGDLSTQVTVERVLGTTRTVLSALDRVGAGLRNTNRLDPNFPLRFMGPAWLLNNMITDLAREMPGSTDERLAMSEAQIAAFMAARHFNVTWFLDGEVGQIFAAQGDGALLDFPETAICYTYIEGSWLHLDAGEMDFGIVRDSVLNSTNDFQMFSETFEESAFHGAPGTSYRLAIDICPTGETSGSTDLSDLCVGS